MPDKAKFWDRIAEKYSKQPIAQQKAYEIKLDLTREYFTPDSKVLEFGCGTGSTAILHAPYVKHIDVLSTEKPRFRPVVVRVRCHRAGARGSFHHSF